MVSTVETDLIQFKDKDALLAELKLLPVKPANGYSKDEFTALGAKRFEGVDWTQTNCDIGAALGMPGHTVMKWRKRLGIPSNPVRRLFDFSKVDWTKRDTEIAGELGVCYATVLRYRRMFGKPLPPNHWRRDASLRASEKYRNLDWSKRDIDLARQIGVSRERIRQWRKELKQPKSPISHKTQIYLNFVEHFKDRIAKKEMISYAEAKEVVKVCNATFQLWRKKLGLPKPPTRRLGIPWHLIDFRLQDRLILEIWKIHHTQYAASRRWNHSKGPAIARVYKGQPIPDVLKPIIEQQTLAAEEWFKEHPKP